MRSVLTFSLLVFCLLGTLKGQTVLRDGFVITNQGDTLHGLVDYRGEFRNMKVCNFKKDNTSEIEEFLPGSIKGYRYTEGKYYVSKYIETKEFADTVFVEFLLKGISNLYYYHGGDYAGYFIESTKGELFELKRKRVEVIKNGRTYLKEDQKYKGFLTYAFKDCPELRKDIERVQIGHKGLIEITKKYHDYMCDDEKCIVYEKEIPVLKVQMQPFFGYSNSNLSYTKGELSNIDFSASNSIVGGLGFNFILPRLNEKMTLFSNIQMTKDYFHGTYYNDSFYTKYYYEAQIKTTNLSFDGGLRYTYPKGKFRPFVNAGVLFNWSIKNSANILEDQIAGGVVRSKYAEEIEGVNVDKTGYLGGIGCNYHLRNIIGFIRIEYRNMRGDVESSSFDVDVKEEVSIFQLSAGIIL